MKKWPLPSRYPSHLLASDWGAKHSLQFLTNSRSLFTFIFLWFDRGFGLETRRLWRPGSLARKEKEELRRDYAPPARKFDSRYGGRVSSQVLLFSISSEPRIAFPSVFYLILNENRKGYPRISCPRHLILYKNRDGGPKRSCGSHFPVSFLFLYEIKRKRGHREVTSETLLPIILEVGTLGHILLTDKFQLRDFFGNSLWGSPAGSPFSLPFNNEKREGPPHGH